VHGKPSRRFESSDVCSLTDQLGSAERGATVELKQFGSEMAEQDPNLGLQFIDALGQLTNTLEQLDCDARSYTSVDRQDLRYPFQDHLAVEGAFRHFEARLELVKVPSKPVLNSGSLSNQVVAVVEQQLDLATCALKSGHWKPAFA
jgi:hypothetical protein